MAIFKATAKRNDGRSSFAALVSYIGREDTHEGREPTAPLIESELFEGMPEHLRGELLTLEDLPGLDDIEQRAPLRQARTLSNVQTLRMGGTGRGRPAPTVPMETNCLDIDTAAAEMQAVAALNPRIKDPVYHFLVSLKKGERLPNEAMFDIARHTMKSLGFEGHQYVAAIHADTDNLHVHVAVNRVHPETYKAVYPDRDHYKGARAMREIELRYGLGHDKGAFAVFERDGETVIDWASKDTRNTKEKAPTKARDMEVRGRESLFSYARGEPRAAIVEALKSPSLSWGELHRIMGRYGLELRQKGQGFAVYDRSNPEQTPIKASDMHERLSKARLEKQLGPYQAAPEIEQPAQTYNPERKPSRDPLRRAERAELRAQQRRELRELYEQAKKPLADEIAKKVQTLKATYALKAKTITEQAQAQRKAIQSGDLPAPMKKAMLSVLAAETVKQRAELREAMKRDRAAIGKVQSYREWVADQAEAGHPAAISALRGYVYADKRKLRQWQQAEQKREGLPGLKAPGEADQEPQAFEFKTFKAITYQVNRQTGDVSYQVAGRAAFTDHGRRITFQAENDDAVILAGLKLAQQKYGQRLDVTGSDAFKRQVAAVAARHGLRVTFTDPAIEQHRQQLAAPTKPAERAAAPKTAEQSRQEAEQLARQAIGQGVRLHAIGEGATARGQIVGETAHHYVQRVSPTVAAIHEKARFAHLPPGQRPKTGQHLAIGYAEGKAKATPIQPPRRGQGLTR